MDDLESQLQLRLSPSLKRRKFIPDHTYNELWLLRYSFIVLSILPFLTDADVLQGFAITMKAIKPILNIYHVRSEISQQLAIEQRCINSYLPIEFTRLRKVTTSRTLKLFPLVHSVNLDRSFHDLSSVSHMPSHIKTLHITRFDLCQIDMFPRGLTSLDVGCKFIEPIKPDDLPPGLTSLRIRSKYSHPFVPGVLPTSLKMLEFDDGDQSFHSGVLPQGLIELRLHRLVEPELGIHELARDVLPSTLKLLEIKNHRTWFLEKSVKDAIMISPHALPEQLTHLYGVIFKDRLIKDQLPNLQVMSGYNDSCEDTFNGITPVNLTELDLLLHLEVDEEYPDPNFALNDSIFPSHLRNLRIHIVSDNGRLDILPGILPSSLRNLILQGSGPNSFNLVPGVIPFGVTDLSLEFNDSDGSGIQTIPPGIIPNSVIHLQLSDWYTRMKLGSIPSSVKRLILNDCVIDHKHIPDSVTHLLIRYSGDDLFVDYCTCESADRQRYLFKVESGCYSSENLLVHLHAGDVPNTITNLALDFHSSSFCSRRSNYDSAPEGTIPTSVTHLGLGSFFESSSINSSWTPNSVTHLSLNCDNFDPPIQFPSSVTCAYFTNTIKSSDMVNPPSRIEFLTSSSRQSLFENQTPVWWIT